VLGRILAMKIGAVLVGEGVPSPENSALTADGAIIKAATHTKPMTRAASCRHLGEALNRHWAKPLTPSL
jgi:hypothetical protein